MPTIMRENDFQPQILHLTAICQVWWFNEGIFRHIGLKNYLSATLSQEAAENHQNKENVGLRRDFNLTERRKEPQGGRESPRQEPGVSLARPGWHSLGQAHGSPAASSPGGVNSAVRPPASRQPWTEKYRGCTDLIPFFFFFFFFFFVFSWPHSQHTEVPRLGV